MASEKAVATADGVAVHCAHDEVVKLDQLAEHPRNPNVHPARQIELLARIIREQGWRAPITVSTRSGYITRGHGRLQAARKAGLSEAPVDRQDYHSEYAEMADLLADNRISELSSFNSNLVSELLSDIGEDYMDLTGFDFDARTDLMSATGKVDLGDALEIVDPRDVNTDPIWFTVRVGQENREAIHKMIAIARENGIRYETNTEER